MTIELGKPLCFGRPDEYCFGQNNWCKTCRMHEGVEEEMGSDRERRELKRLREKYESNERYRYAIYRGCFLSVTFFWVADWITGFDTTQERTVIIFVSFILMGLGLLSNYYGRFRIESYPIYLAEARARENNFKEVRKW